MKVSKISVEDWNSFLLACPDACFFQTPEWYSIWEKTFGVSFECLEYQFGNGNKYLFPRQIRKRLYGLTREYLSGPVGTYGGFIGKNMPSKSQAIKLTESLQSIRHLTLVQSPHYPLNVIKPKNKSTTSTIDLDQFKSIEIISTWTNSGRKNYKLSRKKEFTFSNKLNDNTILAYFELYQQSIKRWGKKASNNYPFELFQNIFEINKENVELLFLELGNKMVCGGIFFKFNRIFCNI